MDRTRLLVGRGLCGVTPAPWDRNSQMALLSEYRARLIADVVTGKLGVRKAAARLPDGVEVPEPLDEADVLTDAEDATAAGLDAAPEEAEA